MGYALSMAWAHIGPWSFRLLWNGKAYTEWNAEYGGKDVNVTDPTGVANLLLLMGREAAAARRVYGYEPDELPDEKEFLQYMEYAASPTELMNAIQYLNAALTVNTGRDYLPNDGVVDIDTMELKKN